MENNKPRDTFISFCTGKISPLEPTKDKFGNEYQTFMKGSINGSKECSIVCVKDHYNDLCWIDSKGNINIADTSSSFVYAVAKRFDEIDKNYYNALIKNWSNLKLDVLDYIINKQKTKEQDEEYSK